MVNKGVVYIGIGNSVLALDKATGRERWRTELRWSHHALNVALIDGQLYASSLGEVWALDPETGDIRWHNKLKGLRTGLVTFAGPTTLQQQATAGGATASAQAAAAAAS